MKRVSGLLLSAALLLGLFSGCAAPKKTAAAEIKTYRDIPGVTQEDISAVEEALRGRARFTYAMNYSAETFVSVGGAVGGFSARLCGLLSELFGMPFEVEICEWDELLDGLAGQTIDFTGELTATPERMTRYAMSHPIAERSIKIITHQDAKPLDEIARTRALRFAFLEGTTTPDYIRETSTLPFVEVYLGNYEEVAEMLEGGSIDAFFEESPAVAAFDGYAFVKDEDYFPLIYAPVSLSTGNPRLAVFIHILDKYIENDTEGTLNRLYHEGNQEYLRHKLFMRLTPEERQYLAARRITGVPVSLLAEYDNYPTCFYNEQEGEFQGIAIDVLKRITELTDLTFQPVNETGTEWSALLEALESGKAAIISELIYSTDRAGKFLWPDLPNTVDYYALLSRAEQPNIDINQIVNAKVGLVLDSAYEEAFLEWFPGSRNTQTYLSTEEAFIALEQGEVDFVMATRNLLLSLTNYMEKPGFKANVVFKRSYDSLLGLNKKEAILCSIISKAQRLIDIEGISDGWTRRVFDYRAKVARAQVPYLIGIVGVLSAAFFLALFLFAKIRRTNKNLEVIVGQRTHELTVQTRMAQAASEAKGEFLARMSHEIRTPLNAIMGMNLITKQLVEDGKHKDKVLSSLEEISTASEHLLGILNDVLDMSKIESGKFELSCAPFALRQAMDEVSAIISQRCNEKEIAFEHNIGDIPDVGVTGDKLRLKQVLINLLGNAVKFTDGGGRILFQTEVLGETADQIKISFLVRDNGIGMSEDQLSRLFVAFDQTDKSIAARFGGTGLGLAISQNLVGKMGGRIEAASQPGEGSDFTFTLELEKAELEQPDTQTPAALPDLSGKRILLAEDVDINRIILAELLSQTGVDIEEAEDGQRAVEMFEASPIGYYDLIFMDVQMPRMDGYEATARIRALERPDAATASIIAMTANAYKEDIDKALATGMNGHLAKPIDIAAVMRVLAERLLT